MIRGYSDHAANERTFLAWVRTAIAVIAFGLVIEKFNLFVLTVANANSLDAERRVQLERLSGPLGRYDGLALILFGLVPVVIAATRNVRTERLLDDQEVHSPSVGRAEVLSSAALTLFVVGCSITSRSADGILGCALAANFVTTRSKRANFRAGRCSSR
jgi:putative membrane protein